MRIVQPEVLVSFGALGCRNVARILLEENPGNGQLERLTSNKPLGRLMDGISSEVGEEGIAAEFGGAALRFWPVYQPARIGLNRYPGDYDVLRKLLGLRGA